MSETMKLGRRLAATPGVSTAIIATVVIVVVGVAAIAYLASSGVPQPAPATSIFTSPTHSIASSNSTTNQPLTTSSTFTTSPSSDPMENGTSPLCGTFFPAGLVTQKGDWSYDGGAGRQIITFLLPTNSTGTICMSFGKFNSTQSSLPSFNPTSLSASVLSLNVTYSKGSGGAEGYSVNSYNPAGNVTLTTSLQYFTYYANSTAPNQAKSGTTYLVAAFTIKASSETNGIYTLASQGDCPPWIPITIGYNITEAQAMINSEYPIFLFPGSCTVGPYGNPVVIGVGGSMQVNYVAANQAGI